MHEMRWMTGIACLMAGLLFPLRTAPAAPDRPAEGATAVLCDPQDAYYPLAIEISRDESLPLYHSRERALAAAPRFLLWVGSPGCFTDRQLLSFGRAESPRHAVVGTGIISGKTIEDARALYQRAARSGGERIFAVNGEYPAARVFRGRILTGGGTVRVAAELNKPNLISVLQQSDYLTFTGHGGGSYWRLGEGVVFTSEEVPALPPTVIATASCQNLRPGASSSIALASVAQGAAAYCGFLFSPVEGYLMGEFDGFPFRWTSPELTIGEAVQLQNQGTVRAFAASPFYLILGDPRISLQREPVCRALRIETSRGTRTIYCGEVEPGVVPLRVRDGARYRFVELPNVSSASDEDRFYNGRLQIANQGEDKLILAWHPGGELQVTLRSEAPRLWSITDPVTDSLEHTLVFLPGTGGRFQPLMMALTALAVTFFAIRRRQLPFSILPAGLLASLTVGLMLWLYVSERLPHTSVTSKPLVLDPLAITALALLAGAGSIVYLGSRTAAGRLLGTGIAVLPALLALVFNLAAVSVMNFMHSRSSAGAGIYGYSTAWMALIGMVAHGLVFCAVAILLKRAWIKNDRPAASIET